MAFDNYYDQLMALADGKSMAWGTKPVDATVLQTILRLPDVVQTDNQTLSETEEHTLMHAVNEALEHIDAFRTQEGAKLIADLLKRIDKIEALKKWCHPLRKKREPKQLKNAFGENIEAIGIR